MAFSVVKDNRIGGNHIVEVRDYDPVIGDETTESARLNYELVKNSPRDKFYSGVITSLIFSHQASVGSFGTSKTERGITSLMESWHGPRLANHFKSISGVGQA